MDWAKKLPIKYKINMFNGVKYGKWILRKAYEDVIPKMLFGDLKHHSKPELELKHCEHISTT